MQVKWYILNKIYNEYLGYNLLLYVMKRINSSILKHLSAFQINTENVFKEFPNLYMAAEMSHDLFDQIFCEQFKPTPNEEWTHSVEQMIFGSHESWLLGLLNTTAGYNYNGITSIRRGIDYICYAYKIKKSSKNNLIWVKKNFDEHCAKEFTAKFSIPKAYFTSKYEMLRPLLIFHKFASNYGVHGNFSTLAGKTKYEENKPFVMSFHDPIDRIPKSTAVSIRIGYYMIKTIYEGFKESFVDAEKFSKQINILNEMINKVKKDILLFENSGILTHDDLMAIYNSDETFFVEEFEKLRKDYE